jgi:hypothetical protein
MINWCFASGGERWSYSIAPSSACSLSYPCWLFTKLAAVSLMQWLRIGKRRCHRRTAKFNVSRIVDRVCSE